MSTAPEDLNQILKNLKPKWYYRWCPFLPRFENNVALKLFIISWRDCSYYERPVGKRYYFFDLLIDNHASPWYIPTLAGFQIWY